MTSGELASEVPCPHVQIDVQCTAGCSWEDVLQPLGEARNTRPFALEEGGAHLAVWQQTGCTEEGVNALG